jgi:hypothetical protein
MQINETKKFDVVLHFTKAFTFLTALTVVVLALHSPTLAWLLGGERTVQVSAAPAAPIPPAAPTPDVPAEDDGYLDTTAEGQDVLMLDTAASPGALVEALRAAGYVGTPDDGCECLYIPVGTTVAVPGGLYLATLDGFAQCADFHTSDTECGADGPFRLTHIPVVPVDHGDGCAVAAGLILDALSTDAIYEDFSYAGMPDLVSGCNDELATAFWAEHRATGVDMATWLAQRATPQNPAILTA